ncbi:hypothetical protein A5886_000355 [Enterococcus sp. 8G7_MSG3316]|uniref:Uncharacterized protein n=1 Tax=Candidatus Enterococcus testudinis TaxID=1834191 RepID=A0A242A2M5_9ENTE|nr:hypothetical protein A5886_000355 [Enterococcus sp. 8G7_MSG3316]
MKTKRRKTPVLKASQCAILETHELKQTYGSGNQQTRYTPNGFNQGQPLKEGLGK